MLPTICTAQYTASVKERINQSLMAYLKKGNVSDRKFKSTYFRCGEELYKKSAFRSNYSRTKSINKHSLLGYYLVDVENIDTITANQDSTTLNYKVVTTKSSTKKNFRSLVGTWNFTILITASCVEITWEDGLYEYSIDTIMLDSCKSN